MDTSFDKNIKSLNVIRGITALIVVVYHAKFIMWCGGELYIREKGLHNLLDYFLFGLDMMSSAGSQAVTVFFILSGFVIHNSFKNKKQNLLKFYITRIIRIYIPYICAILFSLLTLYFAVKCFPEIAIKNLREYNTRIVVAYSDIGWNSFFKSLIFQKSKDFVGLNYAFWSLKHEAFFYIVYPFYFIVGQRIRLVLLALFFVSAYYLKSYLLYFQLFFLVGILLNDFYSTNSSFLPKSLRKGKFYWLGLVVGYILINILEKLHFKFISDFVAIFVVTLFVFDRIINLGIKENKFLGELSNMSYTLYLNHIPILLMCYLIGVNTLNKLIFFERYPYYLSIIVVLLGSYTIYNIFEKPSLVLLKKINKKWN